MGIKTVNVTRLQAVRIILAQKKEGTFFSVVGIKRSTGELRHFKSVRGGVVKYVNGTGMNYVPGEHGLINVFEAGNTAEANQKDKYRQIAVEGIQSVTARGIEYKVVGE